jgi:hypothetical protein
VDDEKVTAVATGGETWLDVLLGASRSQTLSAAEAAGRRCYKMFKVQEKINAEWHSVGMASQTAR